MTASTSPSSPTQRRYPGELLADVAGDYIGELQRGYRRDESTAVATLARLRRGAGKLPEQVPELWGLTGAERLYQRQAFDDPRVESALFLTLTLYALHQQSHGVGMHQSRVSLGAAVRRLMGVEIDEPIRRRFVRIGTASSLSTLAFRLRELISLLRQAAIPLDYAQLARQLYQAQLPGGLAQVRQEWGRGFHAYRPPTTNPAAASTPTGDETTDKESR